MATGAVLLAPQAQGLLFPGQECCMLQLVLHLEKNTFGYHYQDRSLFIFCFAMMTGNIIRSRVLLPS